MVQLDRSYIAFVLNLERVYTYNQYLYNGFRYLWMGWYFRAVWVIYSVRTVFLLLFTNVLLNSMLHF